MEFYSYPCPCFKIIYVIPWIWIVTFNIYGFAHVRGKKKGILYMDGLDNVFNFFVICYQLNQLLNLFWSCSKANDRLDIRRFPIFTQIALFLEHHPQCGAIVIYQIKFDCESRVLVDHQGGILEFSNNP